VGGTGRNGAKSGRDERYESGGEVVEGKEVTARCGRNGMVLVWSQM
jgi:hypothetical protein